VSVSLSIVAPAKPFIAAQTLAAIEQALVADQGLKFTSLLKETINEITDAYNQGQGGYRSHLGASLIGGECLREQWYSFRWAQAFRKTGRLIRLFNRGHLEEARMIALLRMINVQVWTIDENGEQYKITAHGGHFGGSNDAVVLGIPECPTTALLCEFKTHNDDSFTKLVSQGVRVSKPVYYTQMQMYMGGHKLQGALYLAANKNDDDLHAELIEFNPEIYKERLDKGKFIIESRDPPPKINESPGWFKCRMCYQRGICHKIPDADGNIPVPQINCRTCVFSRPVDGGWSCTNYLVHRSDELLTKEEQIKGCDKHTVIKM